MFVFIILHNCRLYVYIGLCRLLLFGHKKYDTRKGVFIFYSITLLQFLASVSDDL